MRDLASRIRTILGESTLTSENQHYGFFGTLRDNCKAYPDTATAFNAAARIVSALYSLSGNEAVQLLDSKWGRHTADGVINADPTTPDEFRDALTRVISSKDAIRAARPEIAHIRSSDN